MTATRKPKPPTEANLKRDLATATRLSKAARERSEEADAERDRVIRDAIAAKIPRADIIAITGLSPARIEQIKRGKRL
jgi:hypothetical protein